ncbi:unnamed protein product [Lactuca saligna]|uniref:Germin-like protein n=1 Tax=Lactuca saligna TaxID=75948 RepID=A0AA36A4Y6_LACSI|nr:unnamed protein product [Lactuca saligna]
MAKQLSHISLVALAFFGLTFAYEPDALQDFCVADPNSSVNVNGKTCKNPTQIQANDFYFSGLHLMGNISNPLGLRVTPVTVAQLPGLNTLGISMVRIDLAPWGINPPHTHPRATEIITVLEGSIQVGFITSDPENRLISKVLYKGDVFVFPVGLVHFQRNIGNKSAVVIGALSSQNPGAITIGNAVFGSNPTISSDVLAKAFQVDKKLIDQLKGRF